MGVIDVGGRVDVAGVVGDALEDVGEVADERAVGVEELFLSLKILLVELFVEGGD